MGFASKSGEVVAAVTAGRDQAVAAGRGKCYGWSRNLD